MQFKPLAILTVALSACHAQAALSPQDIVTNINDITNASSDALDTVKNLNPSTVFTEGPKLVGNFKAIITLVVKDIATMGSSKSDGSFPKDGQQDICQAFTGFIKVHQDLLKLLIGKGGLLSSTPFTAPIAAVLRALEGGVDKLAFSIIGLVPTCADGAKADLKKLDSTLDDAVKAFSPSASSFSFGGGQKFKRM